MSTEWADRLDRVAAVCAATAGAAIALAMVAIVLVAIVFRYGLGAPLIYSYDLSTLLFAWMIFLGLGVAERDGAHLSLDVLRFVVSPRAERVVAVLRQALMIAAALYMAWIGTRLTLRTGMEITSMRVSQKWLYAAMPVGFALLALAYALRLPAIVRGEVRRTEA